MVSAHIPILPRFSTGMDGKMGKKSKKGKKSNKGKTYLI